jgi:hypothetical protein
MENIKMNEVVSEAVARELLNEINETLEVRKSFTESEDNIARDVLLETIMRGRLIFDAPERKFIYQLKYPLKEGTEDIKEITLKPLKVAQLSDMKRFKDDDIGRILCALHASSGIAQRILSELDTKDYAVLSFCVQYFL